MKKIINDFVFLLKYLDKDNKKCNKDNNNSEDEIKISEINNRIEDSISDDFIEIFEDNNELTVGKTFSIFDYYLKKVYEKAKIELNQYQEELNENSKELINKYYQNKEEINKKEIAFEIRLFFTLILFNFQGNENTIKNNGNEIINYLFDSSFNSNLKLLKLCQIKINQIISLYEFFAKELNEDYFDNDDKEEIKRDDSNNSKNSDKEIYSNEDDEDDEDDDKRY